MDSKIIKKLAELESKTGARLSGIVSKYICVWGDETTEPDSAFVAAWREPEEELKRGQNN